MTQADSVLSTPPTNTPTTRRQFLSNAAGLAAGGTALALATISAMVSSDVDPIIALIEEYRTAAKTVAAAAEHSRREKALIELGFGLSPFISVLDVSGPGRAQPMVVYKHEYVDRLLPPDRFSEPNAAAHASLDAQIERHKAILGDSDLNFYIVINDYGTDLGLAFAETDVAQADLETTIGLLMSGQYSNPVRVVAFNIAEHWAEDASEDIAREISRRANLAGHELPSSIEAFVDSHLGPDRQLTLRLA